MIHYKSFKIKTYQKADLWFATVLEPATNKPVHTTKGNKARAAVVYKARKWIDSDDE